MTTSFITARDIEKVFRKTAVHTVALAGASFSVERGSFTVVAGPSGSGKTTLLSIIGGMAAMDAGTLTVGGRAINGLGEDARALYRRSSVGYVFQGNNLVASLNVGENVMLPAQLNGMSDARMRMERLLAMVELSGREDSFPAELSGGEQQRVAIARALVHDPAVVLADEPTANLDSVTGASVMDVFDAAKKETGATVIMTTHDPMILDRGYDRLNMKDGVIVSG